MSAPKPGMLRGTPLQTLTTSIGQIEKNVEVDIPAGEAMHWAAQKPPLFEIAKTGEARPAKPAAKAKK